MAMLLDDWVGHSRGHRRKHCVPVGKQPDGTISAHGGAMVVGKGRGWADGHIRAGRLEVVRVLRFGRRTVRMVRLSDCQKLASTPPLFVASNGKEYHARPGVQPQGKEWKGFWVPMLPDEQRRVESASRASQMSRADFVRAAIFDACDEVDDSR